LLLEPLHHCGLELLLQPDYAAPRTGFI
jgi:hypothetical protein